MPSSDVLINHDLQALDYVKRFREWCTHRQGKEMPTPPNAGYLELKFFPELTGQPLNPLAVSLIYSLYPRLVRIIPYGSEETTDAIPGRVTINLDKNGNIDTISRECQVAFGSGAAVRRQYECDLRDEEFFPRHHQAL